MYYSINNKWFSEPFLAHYRNFWVKVIVIGVGLAIGGCLGLYFAARTLPLPHDYTPVYIIRSKI